MAVSKCGLQVGDLVEFDKIVYEHWAVYVGDNRIVHYKKVGKVGEVVCEDIDSYISDRFVLFRRAKKKKMGIINRIVHESPIFSGNQVAERALSKVGMTGYNLLFKNCEHFAKWCKYNVPMSEQVENGVEVGLVGIGAGIGGVIGGGIGLVGGPVGAAAGAVVGGGIGAGAGLAAAGIHWVAISIGRKRRKRL